MAFNVDDIKVVDIDSHYTEPADLWISRAPAKYKELVPRIKADEKGVEQWYIEGDKPFSPLGFTVVQQDGGKVRGTISLTRFEDLDKAAWDPEARLKLLDRLGIHQQIVYPNVAGFGSASFMRIKDNELRKLCATSYNDAIIEMQNVGKNRLFPQAVVPFWDINDAAAETQRGGDAGITGITMTDTPEVFGFPYLDDPYWEPLWHTCEEYGMPVNFHIGAGGSFEHIQKSTWPSLSPQRRLAFGSIALFLDNFRVVSNLILSGLLERHPTLKFVSVESGIGWVPFVLEALEYQFDESMPDEREGLSLRPREYFRRQIYASFWFEDFGPRAAIQEIGEGNVMFETDFPHPTCLYPKSQEHITNVLADMDDGVRRKILRENAVEVYHLPD